MPIDTRPLDYLQEFWASPRPAEAMWDSWEAPHRTQILTALACIPPFKSVYELGAGAGPNLRLIKRHRPQVTIGGSDGNAGLAAWGSEHLGALIEPKGFPYVPGPEWDVLVSCYALAYVDEPTVRRVLNDAQAKHFVILEPSAGVEPFGAPGLYEGHAMPCFVHDYQSLAERAGWRTLWRWPLYPHHQGLNVVLTLERIT